MGNLLKDYITKEARGVGIIGDDGVTGIASATSKPASAKQNSTKGAKPEDKPWNKESFKKEAFFPPVELKGLVGNANKLFPYKLLVIDVSDGKNKIVNAGSVNDSFTYRKSNTGGLQFKLEAKNTWEITLPITPQQLSITDHFAINTTATMRGVVEEHNGVKFKTISASGTTGIWPTRNTLEDPQSGDSNSGKGNSLFGGTLEAFSQLKDTFDVLKNSIKTGKSGKKLAPLAKVTGDAGGANTGYFQAILIQQFLEQYAMAKKNPANKHWRLVFHYPKNNESFVVTPMQYSVTKSQRSPGESLYNMQFKAWKRIDLKGSNQSASSKDKIAKLTPNFFQSLNNRLDNARSLMSASINVVKAVRADFRKPFDTLRKVTLLIKDFAGLATAISDLPSQIVSDITSATKKRSKDIDIAFASGRNENEVRKTLAVITAASYLTEGMSDDQIESGELGVDARNANKTSSVNNVFDEPEGNFDFFNIFSVGDLDLTPEQQIAIQDEVELNSLISNKEIRGFITEIQDLALDLSNNFGAGDEFFSDVYGRPVPKERATPMTIQEFELLASLEEVVLGMNSLIATREFDDVRLENPLEYVGGLADDADIPFDSTYSGKYLSPVPFGLTIQEISARFLGDPDKYNEIITINNLRSPYIDEDGFFYTFLSNGAGRQFNIDSKTNLYIGQKIQISSSTVPMFTRKITAIEKITDTNFLITVDGVSDLSSLSTNDNSKMKAFLPGTTNSQNQIYIPTNDYENEESRTYDIPYLKGDTLTDLSKIDWLLDESGDVVLNSFGEVGLANGLTNFVQSLKMKVLTQKSSLLSNPEYGIGLKPGIIASDVSVENILSDLRQMITSDPRFEAVDKIEMDLLPPEISITISTRLANGRGVFPINFSIPV